MSSGSIGSLAEGEFAYGDNDSLGFSTLYVRLTGAISPSNKYAGYVEFSRTTIFSSGWSGYKWTASASGTNEYYLELSAGGDPSYNAPTFLSMNGVKAKFVPAPNSQCSLSNLLMLSIQVSSQPRNIATF